MSSKRIISVVAVILLGYTNAFTTEDQASIDVAMRPYISECCKKHGVPEGQYAEAHKQGTTVGIDPCFYSCVLKAADIFDSKGLFDVQKSLEFAKNNVKSENGIAFYNKFSTYCAKVNDISDEEEACDRAKQFVECFHEQMREKAN